MTNLIKKNNCMTLREWQQLYKDPYNLIVQASAIDGSDSWQHFPIGMNWTYMNNYEKGSQIQIGTHNLMMTSCFNSNTDTRRRSNHKINRQVIERNLLQNHISNEVIPTDKYFEILPTINL